MLFGGDYVYAPGKSGEKDDFEYVPESRYNRKVTGSSAAADYDDDVETCLLYILDTAGQEEFSAMRDQYVRSGEGFLMVYSITDRNSFDQVQSLYDRTRRIRDEELPMVFCGNKCDLESERQVSTQEGAAFAKQVGWPFFETSAKMNLNVSEAFYELVRQSPRHTGKEYKFVIQGAGGVGKSAIFIQFKPRLIDCFPYTDESEDAYHKQLVVGGMPKRDSKGKAKGTGSSSSRGRSGSKGGLFRNWFKKSSASPSFTPSATASAPELAPAKPKEKMVKVVVK